MDFVRRDSTNVVNISDRNIHVEFDLIKDIWPRFLVCKNMRKISKNNKGSTKYELQNIFERYMTATYPLYKFTDNPDATKQLIKELKEKKVSHLWEQIKDVDKIDTQERIYLNQDDLTIAGHDDFVLFKYRSFSHSLAKSKFILLYNALNDKKNAELTIFISLLHYLTLMPRGQQWSIPLSNYKKYMGKGVTIEGFASPFNSRALQIGDKNFRYCSVSSTDVPFGSLGNFFDQNFKGYTVVINPPFIESILERTAVKCSEQLEMHPCKFVFNGPNWSDSKYFQILSKSKFLTDTKFYKKGQHTYEDTSGKEFTANFGSVVFQLERFD